MRVAPVEPRFSRWTAGLALTRATYDLIRTRFNGEIVWKWPEPFQRPDGVPVDELSDYPAEVLPRGNSRITPAQGGGDVKKLSHFVSKLPPTCRKRGIGYGAHILPR